MIITKLMKDGEKKYIKFIEKLGLDYSNLMTPHSCWMEEFGELDEDSDEFMKLALTELLKNYGVYADD